MIVETKRVWYDGKYALIVPDNAAGKSKRFTVYLIPASPSRSVRIVGRELPLGLSKKIARYHLKKHKSL